LKGLRNCQAKSFPTGYEKLAFQEAVKRAKREAALETAIEESLLLNPDRYYAI
jgi:hypothetical protein